MAKRYGSKVLASVHETALDMTEAGVMSKRTMKGFDKMCLTPIEDLAPEEIRETRLREWEPGGVCALPQRDQGAGEPVGARREAPARRFVEAPDAGGEERSRGGCLTRGASGDRNGQGRPSEWMFGALIGQV